MSTAAKRNLSPDRSGAACARDRKEQHVILVIGEELLSAQSTVVRAA
ncbi:MAG: hypothetical protein ACLP01_02145 [Solirubrobacteraceae bacterium]